MTVAEFKDIETRLSVWRAERHLKVSEQEKGLLSNLLEELTELSRAQNDEEKIDAYCDMIVFLINASSSLNADHCCNMTMHIHSIIDIEYLVSEVIDSALRSEYKIFLLLLQIDRMGYDSYKCMLETCKEISSRTGHYDESLKKFIKDKSPEAQAKWYKADYKNCKI